MLEQKRKIKNKNVLNKKINQKKELERVNEFYKLCQLYTNFFHFSEKCSNISGFISTWYFLGV